MSDSKQRFYVAAAFGIVTVLLTAAQRRRQRAVPTDPQLETLPSIIEQFRSLRLNYDATIEEANKKRTANYYEKARDAHLYDLVVGVRSVPLLVQKRARTLQNIYHYYHNKTKSHRTIIVMCDESTQSILEEARSNILAPLQYQHDLSTQGVWIPQPNLIPAAHLHVSVAIPWWWHTMKAGNQELSQQLVARFRQALVVNMHHAFQIELERIVLLGGSTLVALWRCVGERTTQDGHTIYDRHGATLDPFVALRRDIVRCFATEDLFQPLTYHSTQTTPPLNETATPVSSPSRPHRRSNTMGSMNVTTPERSSTKVAPPPRRGLVRSNTIELKTPGLGEHDGFIHTTLARLPLDCLSMTDVELGPIHRLCREATATYCGHRMVVDRYRFLETIGAGGESDPCVDPIFDETVMAPTRVYMNGGQASEVDLHASKKVESSATIGAIQKMEQRPRADSLFELNEEKKSCI
ncbi:hypothetical protein FisN_12Lh123 [Fistulifera solaris]|uniref:Uncharacterized protein n=1 Tax=Fistulifera solaris TaxID=1519565 RepID=A0A1Z5JMC6_FISSO|nr:hypothetical protein FisN_12Lh123 [Fistulifera solaris]|eukprot:GAX15173.1 hypothetical protein FisN_12Lh123 [Fistulifera solaris]